MQIERPVPLMEENQSLLEEKGKKAPPAGGEFPGLAAHTLIDGLSLMIDELVSCRTTKFEFKLVGWHITLNHAKLLTNRHGA